MDYCVMCGNYVPEGSMVCKQCWVKIMGRRCKNVSLQKMWKATEL